METLYFNKEKIKEETIKKTDLYFAEVQQGCIDEVLNGQVKVNDKEKYIKDCKERKSKYLKGIANRNNLTYLQRAYYIQTGKCIALLP